MITLTQEQLQPIQERLLIKYGLQYDEIREELLDHIACEVEDLMNQGESYEEATILVFRKWNVRLISNEKGWYRGIPHFVLNQLNSEYKKVEVISIVLAILFAFLLVVVSSYFMINRLLLLVSLFLIHTMGVFVIHRELQGMKDYRYDFFKQKSLSILINSVLVLVGILLFYATWGIDSYIFSFDMLAIYYFILNFFLLIRFRKYCKHQQFKIAK